MEINENIIEKAAMVIGISRETATQNCRYLENIDAFYVYNPIRGGGAVIIRNEKDFLFATSAVTLESHIDAFVSGKRTVSSIFDCND